MTVFSREALYERVWADPVRTVAQTFGMSETWLKKICVAAVVPVPDRGYWAKLRAGKRAVRAPLPPRPPGLSHDVSIRSPHSGSYWNNPEAELADLDLVEPEFAEPLEEVRVRVEKLVGAVKYIRSLDHCHPLIAKLLDEDSRRRPPPDPLRSRYWSPKPLFDSAFEKRRLRILNSIFMAAAKAGAHAWITDKEARLIGCVVGHQSVPFKLDHPDAKPDRNGAWSTREGFGDVLLLTISVRSAEGGVRRSFSDTEERSIDADLIEIVRSIILAGEINYREGARAAYLKTLERRDQLEKAIKQTQTEKARQARAAAMAAEDVRRTALLHLAAALRSSNEIRSLVAEVLAKRSQGDDAANVQLWSEWALSVADRLDPVSRLVFQDGGDAELPEPDWLYDRPDVPILLKT